MLDMTLSWQELWVLLEKQCSVYMYLVWWYAPKKDSNENRIALHNCR